MGPTIARGLNVIKHASWSDLQRFLAILRRVSPALAFVPIFIAAQALTILYSQSGFVLLGLTVWRLLATRQFSVLSTAIVAGVLSVWFSFHEVVELPSGDRLYRAEILQPPRYRDAGAVELLLRVALSDEYEIEERNSWIVVCRGPALPWNELGLNAEKLQPGTHLAIRTQLVKLDDPASDPLGFDANQRRRGIDGACKLKLVAVVRGVAPSLIQRVREKLYGVVYSALGQGERAGLLLSLALGKRDTISEQTERAFKRCGIAHLLVLSGYQVMLVYLAMRWCARWILRICFVTSLQRGLIGSHVISIVAGIVTAAFVTIVGVESASMRALLAIGGLIIAVVWERGGGMFNSMLMVLLLMSVWLPGCYFEPGVQLTFAALTGIALGISGRGASKLQKFVLGTILASLFSGVVSMLWFDTFSLLGVLANLVIVPLVSIIACHGGLVGIVTALISPHFGAEILRIVGWILDHFRLAVIDLSRWRFTALELELYGKAAVCTGVIAFGLTILCLRIRSIVAMRGVKMEEW